MSAPVTKAEILAAQRAGGFDVTDPRRIKEAEYQAAAAQSPEARDDLRKTLGQIRRMGRR